MIQLTETAVGKVKEILDQQDPKPAGLRIAVGPWVLRGNLLDELEFFSGALHHEPNE